jgi:hypothetical protein
MVLLDFFPDVALLTQMFEQAIAPTFFLGAIAAFVSLMTSRLSSVMVRMRTLNAIPQNDPARAHLKADIDRLRRRARFLNSGIRAALAGGICATFILAIIFITAFLRLRYAIGAPLLFVIATSLLGFALLRFLQEASLGLDPADEYE